MGVYLRACVRACSVGACVQMCDAVCVCVCVCVHARTRTCVSVLVHVCACTYACSHISISTHVHIRVCICVQLYTFSSLHAHMPACERALMCVCRLWCGGGKQRAAVNEKTTRESRPSRCLPCVRLPRSCSSDWVMGQARASLVTVSDFTD